MVTIESKFDHETFPSSSPPPSSAWVTIPRHDRSRLPAVPLCNRLLSVSVPTANSAFQTRRGSNDDTDEKPPGLVRQSLTASQPRSRRRFDVGILVMPCNPEPE